MTARRLSPAFAAFSMLIAQSGGSAKACGYQADRFGAFGGDVYARMVMVRNEICDHHFRVDGALTISGAKVVEKPRHGVLGVASDGSFAFKPSDGYSGEDRFVIQVSLMKDGRSNPTRINVDVQVRD